MRAGKIFLLLGLLGIGGSVETAYQVRNHVGVGPLGWVVLGGTFHGIHHTYQAAETREVAAGVAVDVDNAFGKVELRAGEPGKVDVRLEKVVYIADEATARALSDKLKIQVSLDGNRLRITTNRAELDTDHIGLQIGFWRSAGFETNLSVRVPPQTLVAIKNAHGAVDVADVGGAAIESSYDDVRLERVQGDARVEARHGDLVAADIGGATSVSLRHGDIALHDAKGDVTVTQAHGDLTARRTGRLKVALEFGDVVAETVAGDLEVRGQHSEVKATDVSGAADIETSYEDVTLTHVKGDARAKAEHGAVKCTDVGGALAVETSFADARVEDVHGHVEADVSHGGLQASRIGAGIRARVEGDETVIEGFRGAVALEAKRGGVKLVPAGPIVDPITASAAFGDLSLEVPEGSRFDLDVVAERGDVDVKLPDLAVSQSKKRAIAGKVGGGGVRVQLGTSHGDIEVTSGSGARITWN